MYMRKPEPDVILPPRADFARRLEYLMIRYGFTAVDLAKKADVKPATIRSYCKCDREPRGMSMMVTIANTFNVSLDWLCGRSNKGGPK